MPRYLSLLSYIDRFGVEAVTGRKTLSYGDMQRMIVSENILLAYQSRKTAENRGKWASDNEQADKLLNDLEVMIYADREN